MNKNKNKKSQSVALCNFFKRKNFAFKYDEVSNVIVWRRGWREKFEPLKERDLWGLVDADHRKTSMEFLMNVVGSSGVSRTFNPIKELLEGLPVPEENSPDPFREYLNYFVLENDTEEERQRFYISLRKWFVGAIKTLYDPYYLHKQVIIFQGKQGIGKTPICQSLLPLPYRRFIKNAPYLDMESKDGRLTLTNKFIIILDEVDKFLTSRNNQNAYKGFITNKYISIRLPYGRTEVERTRIASFVGTCNRATFLKDCTGSTRFSVFSLERVHNKRSRAQKPIEDFDILTCWAQAYQLYRDGYNPEYTDEELDRNEEGNEAHKYNSPEYEAVMEWFAPSERGEEGSTFMTATNICSYLNENRRGVPFSSRAVGRALTRLKFPRCKKKVGGQSIYGYAVKLLKSNTNPTPPYYA